MVDAAKAATVKANYEAFLTLLPALMDEHVGKFVLLRDGKVVEIFDSARDALVFGESTFDDGLFSVQEVMTLTADLGWYSRAPIDATA